MSGRTHEHYARLFQGYFLDELESTERGAFRDHVRGCGECRVEYERWSAAEGALFERREDGAPSPLALARVRRALVPDAAPSTARAPLLKWLAPGLAVAAAFSVVLVVGVDRTGELSARGPGNKLTTDVSARAVAARARDDGEVEVVDLSSPGASIRPSARVRLLYTNATSARFVQAFAETSDGSVHPLGRVETVTSGQPDVVAQTFSLPADWTRGAVRFVWVFAERREDLAPPQPGVKASDGDGKWVRVVEARAEDGPTE